MDNQVYDKFGWKLKNSQFKWGYLIMENEKCGCEDTEYIEELLEDEPKESNECGCGETVETPENPQEKSEECGCGCGGEFPDESLVANPDNPKYIADSNFSEEFEKFAHSMGIVSIAYTQIIPKLINTDEPLKYPNAIVLTLEMGQDIIETSPGPEAQQLNDATYAKLGSITYALSDYLRAKGFATQAAHPYGGLVSFSPTRSKGRFRLDRQKWSSNNP